MMLLLRCLCLISWCGLSGCGAAITLTQPSSAQAEPGSPLTLDCVVSGYNINDHHLHWIRQDPGKSLVWLAAFRTGYSTHIADEFKGRVTPSTSGSTGKLKINSLTAADTATYYCATDEVTVVTTDGSITITGAYFDYWGQGTMVTISSVSPVAPSVFPLTSCTGEGTTSQVTFGCLAKGYFPEPVTVTWSPNVGSSGVKTYPSVLQPSSGLYSLSSQVTVPASSWESNTYSCTVEHQPTSFGISTKIPKSIPIEPKVKVLYNCNTKPDTVELVCFISGFYPKTLTVYWLVNGEQRDGNTDQPTKDADGHTFSTRNNLIVTQNEWKDGTVYTCLVSQPGTTSKQVHARKCEG